MTKKTFAQMLALQNTPTLTKRQRPLKGDKITSITHRSEHDIQEACVRWFRYRHPQLAHNLFAVPNGGRRDAVTGAKLKAEGVLAGVADLILLKSNRYYGALLIEMKTAKGRQSEAQREWQQRITADGYKYVVCRSVEEFRTEVENYLKDI